MTNALLLDTHIGLWLDSGDERLAPATRDLIDGCWTSGGKVGFSAVSFWEIALLVDAGRIELDLPLESWLARFTGRPGVEPVPLTHIAAGHAYSLRGLEHRDPADRLLITTAIELSWPLVTYDERILRFADAHGRTYRFTALRQREP